MTDVEWWKNIASAVQSFGTVSLGLLGGGWAYWKFGIKQDRYPHIETSAEICFIGKHNNEWIVELVTFVDNKGSAQHRMEEFSFDLSALNYDEQLTDADAYGGQVLFPHSIKKGSYLGHYKYFIVDAGVKAKYSFITRVPTTASFLILHSWFSYGDKRKFSHAAETTVKVPEDTTKN